MRLQAVPSLLLSCILLSTNVSTSQEVAKPATTGRPKLGVVLEGGGALGLAHIGVLQWMEEHRIPISYVAGTSMGGLVGGIYATGRSPAEVREITNTINWDEVLRGQTPFQDLSFRRKQDAHEVPNSLEFGLAKGLQFPGGFNSGQQVSLILDKVALPYSELKELQRSPDPICLRRDRPCLRQAACLSQRPSVAGIAIDDVSAGHLHACSDRATTSTQTADCSITFPSTSPKRWAPTSSLASISRPSP